MTFYRILIDYDGGTFVSPRAFKNQLHAEAVCQMIPTLLGCEARVKGYYYEETGSETPMTDGVEVILEAMEAIQ